MKDASPIFIFDLGKVLVDFNYAIAAKKIGDRSTKTPADLHAFLGASPLLGDYECGRLTRETFFQAIRASIDFQGNLEEFGGYFADIFFAIPEMIRLQAELRQRGHKTYIFSNTNDLAVEHIRRNFPFFENFDGYIYSYEVGAMKPQPKIYEAMEAMAGKRGSDLIYIDDRSENIEAGAARGWQTILHETPEQTRRSVEALVH
jgi:FMN phosphatase YigB (HAD superfamily)